MRKKDKLTKVSDLRTVEKALVIDQSLQESGKDTIDKMHHNLDNVSKSVTQSNQMMEDLIKMLEQNRAGQENSDEIIEKTQKINNNLLDENSLQAITMIETPEIYLNWDEQVKENERFAEQQGIDLDMPFINTFSNIERVGLYKELTEKFDIIQLEANDYLFATAAGLIAGFIDAAFVGTITNKTGQAAIPKMIDKKFDQIVTWYGKQEKIAELQKQATKAKSTSATEKLNTMVDKLKKGEKVNKSGDVVKWLKKDSIKQLEKNHRVVYDAAMNKGVKGMSPDNHHLLSIAHEPSLLGLLVGIIDQLTGKATFIDTLGNIIRTNTGNLNNELNGNTIMKISQAVENWFGHIMSDIAGSSSSVGRGSGLPVPGWSVLQKLQIGNFDINGKQMNIAGVSDWMFKSGYDIRSFTAQLIPVVIYETLVRCYWFYKQHIVYGKSIKESFPVANNRELARLLLFSASSFTAVDVIHATIKSYRTGIFDLSTFLMTINYPGLLNFGFKCVQNTKNEIVHRNHVVNVIQNDVMAEYERVLHEIK